MNRDDFLQGAYRRGYRNDPMPLLEALYDAGEGLGADHPYHKLMEDLRQGKAPGEEFADISSGDHPYLVTEEILKAVNAELKGMDASGPVIKAKQLTEGYFEPWMQEHASREREELPLWRAYEKLDKGSLEEAAGIAEEMKADGNVAGRKDSEEFRNMTAAIEDFAASKTGAVYGSVLGEVLREKMAAMGAAIESFIESEKANEKNPNVTLAVTALRMADPARAAKFDRLKTRSRISLDMLDGEKERKPAFKREHAENAAPVLHGRTKQ
ncbi:MAG: hypothetical protein K6B44_02330 [Lachnospiraceae bacterium]|nr:hypothetical protein [Lachnospiraceae bacterium]